MTSHPSSRFVLTSLLSLGVSMSLVGILIHGFSGLSGAEFLPRLVRILRQVGLDYVALYLLSSIVQTFLRAWRYRVILRTGSSSVPGLFHLYIVSQSRNMFVDLLPARIGEISFIAMLNRGYKMAADLCLAALSISFVFDLLALAVLLFLLAIYQLVRSTFEPWLAGVLIGVVILSACGYFMLFPILRWLSPALNRWGNERSRLLRRPVRFLQKTAAALQKAAEAGIFSRVLLLSVGIRIIKYLGLYLLFMAVIVHAYPSIRSDFGAVLTALVSGEASASLPIPSFMSFGTYEAGGALALTALGMDKAGSLIIMLAVHLWSQAIDYSLGIAALVIFFFIVAKTRRPEKRAAGAGIRAWSAAVAFLFCGMLVLAYQLHQLKKMGGFSPPPSGQTVAKAQADGLPEPRLRNLHGFMVWSSNRSGNHDIWRMSLPDKRITRLTRHPNSEYFPRISPNGRFIVFARGHEKYVSQRNLLAWDVIMLDLATGREKLIARNANAPTWSQRGDRIRFEKNGNQFVEYDLASGKEKVLFESGRTLAIPASAALTTPDWSDVRDELAVTLRDGVRGTFIVSAEGALRQVGDGCELAWSPDSSYLYYVDHGGKMENAFYRVDPKTLKRELWFDSPTEYSHEYFPRVGNTGNILVFGASTGGHEHDRADYEIFVWEIGSPPGRPFA